MKLMNNPLMKKHFPNAKFVESENIDIEDDMIELDETYSIQIFEFEAGFGKYSLVKENDDETFSSFDFQYFNSAVYLAVELAK